VDGEADPEPRTLGERYPARAGSRRIAAMLLRFGGEMLLSQDGKQSRALFAKMPRQLPVRGRPFGEQPGGNAADSVNPTARVSN
jgi:hypothetical protein